MSDVLQQDDVDTLIDAVNTGTVAEDGTAGQVFSRFRRGNEQVEIRDHDFRHPERISKDQISALRTLHEGFARGLGAALCGYLRQIVEVTVASAKQTTYGELVRDLPNPTCVSLIEADDLDGPLCLELSPMIIYPIIDRLLGGSSEEVLVPDRAMTAIETRIVQTILTRALAALTEAWQPLKPVEFRLGQIETNPQVLQIVPKNEVVVVISFDIRIAQRNGGMNLIVPFNTIEPFVDDLTAEKWSNPERDRGRSAMREIMAGQVSGASIELRGVLAETAMTLHELRNLEVGDIVVTDHQATAPAVLAVGAKPKFQVHVGQHRGRRALRIVCPVAGPSGSNGETPT